MQEAETTQKQLLDPPHNTGKPPAASGHDVLKRPYP